VDRQPLGQEQGGHLGVRGHRLRRRPVPVPHPRDRLGQWLRVQLAYCTEHQITFTRSRSGNKNDGCHVEQKNWTHVRELVGYLRFDTDAEFATLNQIWELDRTYTNYLLAQQKIVSKQRTGSKVTKRYDRALTPFDRATARTSLAKADRRAMQAVMDAVRPGDLYREIQALTTQLERIALSKAPAAVKPQVNRAFNH
jgi:hypothetical protein